MGKLIDSDDLKLRLKNLHLIATSGYGAEEVVSKTIDEMPEGIVRCKDCKHNPNETWFECPMSMCNENQRPETAWCWKAERRDDGNG